MSVQEIRTIIVTHDDHAPDENEHPALKGALKILCITGDTVDQSSVLVDNTSSHPVALKSNTKCYKHDAGEVFSLEPGYMVSFTFSTEPGKQLELYACQYQLEADLVSIGELMKDLSFPVQPIVN